MTLESAAEAATMPDIPLNRGERRAAASCARRGQPQMRPAGVSVADACAYIGCGTTKMYELIKIGQVRSYRVGRSRRIALDSLDEIANRAT